MFMCPVCFYDNMPNPAQDYHICPCCGTEFGSDDEDHTHAELRDFWISKGAKWFFHQPPRTWNPWQQLADAGVTLPYSTTVTYLSAPSLPLQTQGISGAAIRTGISVYYHHAVAQHPINLLSVNVKTHIDEQDLAIDEQGPTVLVGKFVDKPFGMAA